MIIKYLYFYIFHKFPSIGNPNNYSLVQGINYFTPTNNHIKLLSNDLKCFNLRFIALKYLYKMNTL